MIWRCGWLFFGLSFFVSICDAEEYEIRFDDPQLSGAFLDRWMYPFNQTPGKRIQAPTFGALGSEGFDERDGQYVLAVDTQVAGIAANLPVSQYRVNSARLTLTETFGGYEYDPTYDAFQTYLDPEATLAEEDDDPGRPIELYGIGLRGDYRELGWPDGEALAPPTFGSGSAYGGQGKSVRSVYAADAEGTDVSNNVMSLSGGEGGFDPVPFAIARMMRDDEELEPGETVSALTQWTFDINVQDTSIHDYLANALSLGQLGFAVTSLHTTGVQGQGDPFPNPATANHFVFAGPQLTLDISILENAPGDFDGDGDLTALDIDLLSAAVREGGDVERFDLTADGELDHDDRAFWVEGLAMTNFGDFDLDGEVGFADFLQLSEHFGQAGGWAEGDLDGSREVDFADFLGLSTNFGQTGAAALAHVPEPGARGGLPIVWLVVLLRLRHLRRRQGNG